MSRHASSTFVVRRWDDEPYERIAEAGAGARLSRVSITNVFEGDIEGEGRLEYVMAVPDGESASFAGIQRIAGSVGGLRGSLVLQTVGTFGGGVIQGPWCRGWARASWPPCAARAGCCRTATAAPR